MTDDVDNLVLEHLRRFRETLDRMHDDMREGFSELKHRMSSLEQSVDTSKAIPVKCKS